MSLRQLVRRAAGTLLHRGWAAVRAAGTITPASPGGYRFRALGEGACLAFPTGAIFGEEWIEIGPHTLVGERVSISAGMNPGLDLGPATIVRIGGSCSIGRGTHIVGHQSIDIGDHVFTGPYVYVTDQNHVYDDPAVPIGRQWPRNNPVTIGAGSWIGAGAIILPGTRLGPQTVVAGGAVVRGEFPSHCVLAGVPAKIVRRHTPGSGWHLPEDGAFTGPLAAPLVGPLTDPLTYPLAAPLPGTLSGTLSDTGDDLAAALTRAAGADLPAGLAALDQATARGLRSRNADRDL